MWKLKALISFLAGFGLLLALPAWAIAPVPALDLPRGGLVHVQLETLVDDMNPQMRNAYIRSIQEELAAHGYDPGAADGVVGNRTRAAIREYQRDAGLPVTGNASKELLDHLMFVEPKVYKSDRGFRANPDNRAFVFEIQEKLAIRGYYRDSIDGIAGPNTRAAVDRFQRDAGLPRTGAIDQRLLDELDSADPGIRASPLR